MKRNSRIAGHVSSLFLILLALIFQCALAKEIDAQNIFLPIDVSQPNARVQAEIKINESRLYELYLNVHYRNEDERRHVLKLVGGSGRLNVGGGYTNPGLTILVHLKLTDATGQVLLDTKHETKGNVGHGLGPDLSGEYLRELGEIRMKPGVYHLEATIVEPVSEFQGIECAISIGTRPHTPPLAN